MESTIKFDYFRGMEAEQYTFYRIPKVLFTAECFRSLSCEAKVLYGLLLDRIEGLERLIRNDYQFTISNKSQLLMDEMQEDDDNILSFLESTGYIRLEKGTHATSKDLYIAYCRWCNDNLDVPVSERSFARRFKERSSDYGMTYDKNISVGNGRFCRGFRGIHVKVRTKDVNY